MSVFETQWKGDMTRDDAVKLCSEAILAGIFNDLGSGSNVDVCVITQEKTELLRHHTERKGAQDEELQVPEGYYRSAKPEGDHEGRDQQIRDRARHW